MQRQGAIHKKAFYSLDDLDGKADFSLIVTALSSIRIARITSHKWFGLFVAAVVLLAIQRAISTRPPFVSGRWYNNIVIVVLHPPKGLVLQGQREKFGLYFEEPSRQGKTRLDRGEPRGQDQL